MTDSTVPWNWSAAGRATGADLWRQRALVIVLAVGAALRFLALGQESYWIDEVTMIHATGDSFRAAAGTMLSGGRPPVFVLLLRAWIEVFGTGEVATRSLTALIATGSLFMIYRVGSRLLGRDAALAAAALMAIVPIQLYQAQNIRYYALMVLLGLWAYDAMLTVLRDGRMSAVVWAVVASTLLVYTHPFGIFLVAAQDLYLLLALRRHRRVLGRWIAGQVALAALVAPYFYIWLLRSTNGDGTTTEWLPPVVWQHIPVTLGEYLTFDRPPAASVIISALLVLIGVVLARSGASARAPDRHLPVARGGAQDVRPVLLLVCWLAVPILVPFLLSLVLTPMYLTRYTIDAAPALYLLIGGLVSAGRHRVAYPCATAAAIALVLPSTAAYYPRDLKEDWRHAARLIADSARPGDRILLLPGEGGDTQRALRWYYHGGLPACDLDAFAGASDERVAAEVARCTAGATRVWVVVRGPETITGPFLHYLLQDASSQLAPVESRSFTGIDVHLLAAEAAR